MSDIATEVEKASTTDRVLQMMEDSGLSLHDLMDTLGLVAVKAETERARETRVSRREAWALPKKLEGSELEAIESLKDQLGSGVTPEEPRVLSQQEVDDITQELLNIRTSQDVLEGRHGAIKTTVFNAISAKYFEDDSIAEPEWEGGALYSPTLGYKLCKEIRGGDAYADWDELKNIVDEETWHSITNTVMVDRVVVNNEGTIIDSQSTETREVDPGAVSQAIKDGKLTLDQLKEITKIKKRTAAFVPRPIKAGEAIPR